MKKALLILGIAIVTFFVVVDYNSGITGYSVTDVVRSFFQGFGNGNNAELSPRGSEACVIPKYGDTYNKDTKWCNGVVYQMPQDIYPGVMIKGNDIILDCQGGKIIGVGLDHGIGVHGDRNTVKNCIVENFNHNIHVEGSNNRIVDNVIRGPNEYGIHLAEGGGHFVERNIIENFNDEFKGWIGIGIVPPGPGNVVRSNQVYGNWFFGVYQHGSERDHGDGQASNDIIEDNVINGPDYGITLTEGSDSVTVEGNTISDTQMGISLYTDAIDNIVRSNTITGSGVGIILQHGTYGNEVSNNVLGSDNLEGIRIASGVNVFAQGNIGA